MYPKLVIWDVYIYVFGIFLITAWVLFFYLLHIFSQKKWIVKPIFSDIFSFTLGIFVVSRIFYVFSNWSDTKFIFQEFLSGRTEIGFFISQLVITEDYNLSLAGGIIGFLIIFFWKTKNIKNLRGRYLDIILPAFFISAIIGFIGAFFGGQIFGNTGGIITVDYNTKYSTLSGNRFPLAFFYAIFCLIISLLWKKFDNEKLPDGYTGLVLMGIFGFMIFVWDFFSGSSDSFEVFIRINQFIGISFILFAIIWILRFFRS